VWETLHGFSASDKGTRSIDLGAVCGKPFMVSALAIREPGDSDILKLAEAADV